MPSDVWDPHLQKDITPIDNVQKFGLRICAKQWDLEYDEFMSNFDVCTLQTRRLELAQTLHHVQNCA